MGNENPDSERRPRPEGERLIEMKRSASQVALQAAETIGTGAGLTVGGLAAKDAYGKAKGALGLKGDGSKPKD